MKIPAVNPLVAQIVRQHHERRDRRGYPGKLGPGAITPVAEIVGIADSFQEFAARNKSDPDFHPLREMEKSQFDRFSLPIVEAFQKAFLLKKK
jgi:HD-GYP domain-containing protein (c-di-GMP phosphodiesterase class II)